MANCRCGKQICSIDYCCPDCKHKMNECYDCGELILDGDEYNYEGEYYCENCYSELDIERYDDDYEE